MRRFPPAESLQTARAASVTIDRMVLAAAIVGFGLALMSAVRTGPGGTADAAKSAGVIAGATR